MIAKLKARLFPIRLRLNQKYMLAVFVYALIPFSILFAVLFGNMRNDVINERVNEARRNVAQVQSQAEKIADNCNMTAQFFLNNAKLNDFLLRAARRDAFAPEELIAFYREDVSGFERFVNANPFLYQVRVYYDNSGVPEIMPVLYHSSRMERLDWAGVGQGHWTWYFDYQDLIFPPEIMKPAQNLMGLVIGIDDYNEGRIGVLEVAIRMNELFPELFTRSADYYCGFVTGDKWYYNPGDSDFWEAYEEPLSALAHGATHAGGETEVATLGGRRAYVTSIHINQFDGRYIMVMFRDDITAPLAASRNAVVLIALGSLVLLALAVNILVKAMLFRFYSIVVTVQRVRGGDLLVKAPYLGDDEIGLLAEQINQMLDRIRRLMDENIMRERRAKNSDIRALQSQINAHFIYNVLESVKMMAEVDSMYEISDALTSLGQMMRYSMQWSAVNVTVSDEIEHIMKYIELVNMRFDYAVTLRLDVPARVLEQGIPKLTIQPIVENAVVHGIEELAQDSVIEIGADEAGDYFTLVITDYGKGIAPDRLEYINRRLAGETGEIGDEGIEGNSGNGDVGDIGSSEGDVGDGSGEGDVGDVGDVGGEGDSGDSGDGGDGGGIGLINVQTRIVREFGDGYGLRLESPGDGGTRVAIRLPYTK
ncbi:MAG: histidine kinase [Oscillospiraceae bacterium]|nr:histidine kinase [Oscillospiraceae bacterium]